MFDIFHEVFLTYYSYSADCRKQPLALRDLRPLRAGITFIIKVFTPSTETLIFHSRFHDNTTTSPSLV